MAVIYLRHDKHGTKVACGEQEAAADCANGWQRFSLEDSAQEKAANVPEVAEATKGTKGASDTFVAPVNAFVPVEKAGINSTASDIVVFAPTEKAGIKSLDELRALYQEKFGVKPHHRKLAETLAAEIGA